MTSNEGEQEEQYASERASVDDTALSHQASTSSEESAVDQHFEPIRTRKTRDEADYQFDRGDAATRSELARLASMLSGGQSVRTTTSDGLSRQDTVAGMAPESPEFDPNHPSFNFFLWLRKFAQLLEQQGVKHRRSGFTFKNLNVSGKGAALVLQQTVGSIFMQPFRMREIFSHPPEKQILRNFNGHVDSGEVLIVLGRPGSGCSTFLKTICGELQGLDIPKDSSITYSGIPQDVFLKEFKGEAVYNAENERHFPHLTVGETLEFAAACRTPSNRVFNVPRKAWAKHMSSVMMNIFGLSHTRNTKVGDDFVRGVSGGERKRVSIAEMALAGPPIAAWDNSTRGLDSQTALEFVRSLRIAADVAGLTSLIAIYQASQAIYDLCDKAIVLYEGKQIYFGPTDEAKAYFEDMGWHCPPRQTTGDFLTSITNPRERKARERYENRVPRTAEEFERYWLESPNYKYTQDESSHAAEVNADGKEALDIFRESHKEMQAQHTRPKSPYTISIPMQIRLCTKRAYQRLWNDKASTIAVIFSQVAQALIIGSVYFGTPLSTGSFFAKGAVLFFAVLLSALQSIVEINTLYAQRPIVAKHKSYAFYHPFTEAVAGIVADLPIKFCVTTVFNIVLYFLAGLRTEPSQFFIFFLFNFMAMLTMSAIFRCTAAVTKTISAALAIAGIMVLWIVIYTGFTIQRSYMHPWFKWTSWINPVAYAYEALIVNEVHGREFPCAASSLVPPYGRGNNFQCAVSGAVAGQINVSGDAWVQSSYGYSYSHIWRNLGFLFAFMIFFYAVYFIATELNSDSTSTAEFLVFRRGHVPAYIQNGGRKDEETTDHDEAPIVARDGVDEKQDEDVNALPPQRNVFTWRDVTLDIKIKGEPRRLLDGISGWVKPGTLTALMGTSGAGKTTLLDALAQRTNIGVLTGDMLVNGQPLDASFQRKTGYVQQQDLHLETSTVREALRFSAYLRQDKSVPKQEKDAFVEDVIQMLNMQDFSEAVVGNPGEGLNVEQRKLLTIGVELAAKPALLIFLDEPTSGLDSQSSWSIVAFLRKLADSGQAILCTIHQPSAILFQEFDRLLFLMRGGKTIYFGDIGPNSHVLLDYFERNGAPKCDENANPAEYMLDICGKKSDQDWSEVWKTTPEAREVQAELDRIHAAKRAEPVVDHGPATEFAMPLTSQIKYVTVRVFQQYWRTPSYISGKFILGIMAALFIGFSFYKQNTTQTGLQNTIFAVFMLVTIFSTLVQQIMPRFVIQRSLYEVRERPSKAYSWVAFLVANIVVEIPYQLALAVLMWISWYFAVFGKNQSNQTRGLMLLFVAQFMIFTSTFAHMIIAAMPDAETAGNIATLLFSMMLTFNGVLQSPRALPGFWIFMYRVSPMTYLISGWASTGLHGRHVECARNELAIFDPPSGQTCRQYLAEYLQSGAPGQLYNPSATSGCEYCPLTSADQFLAASNVYYSERWRNFGIGFAYIFFNIFACIMLYYVFRVRRFSITSLAKWPALVADVVLVQGFRRLFARHVEPTPAGKEAQSHKAF
ncbi:GTPase-activating protein [Exophiala xenobiotica]|nr:GTPase-activating protein [Exophiala xenobiotica]KAK5206518.1 GTPase-activating protein [Exophiala xenobiotica]KAK5222359.1 GTPase-activating protein [Exophiala xenobiotica]KAK5316665.1 GTPase-activating protein [Exophiala xenobiotica]KAK5348730.1 GTPase-activating protein [Exophiala xenobiotica]